MEPLTKTALYPSNLGFSLIPKPSRPTPTRYPNIIRVSGLMSSFSIEYLAPIATPIITMRIPILLIQLSPIIFSKSEGCLGLFIVGRENWGLGVEGAVMTGVSVVFSAGASVGLSIGFSTGLSVGFSTGVFTVFTAETEEKLLCLFNSANSFSSCFISL